MTLLLNKTVLSEILTTRILEFNNNEVVVSSSDNYDRSFN